MRKTPSEKIEILYSRMQKNLLDILEIIKKTYNIEERKKPIIKKKSRKKKK